MKHDKVKKQRATVVVPLTAVGREQTRQPSAAEQRGRGQAGAASSCQH